jgi:hypothetical protein
VNGLLSESLREGPSRKLTDCLTPQARSFWNHPRACTAFTRVFLFANEPRDLPIINVQKYWYQV